MSAEIADPLRFGAEEDDIQEDIPLHDPQSNTTAQPPSYLLTQSTTTAMESILLDDTPIPTTISQPPPPPPPQTISSPSSSSPILLRPPSLHITVSDPVKRLSDHSFIPGVSSSHYEYLITSTPLNTDNGVVASSHSVRRRFSDFVSLADILAVTHRGRFLFPRPDKNRLEGQIGGDEFAASRCKELEHYLRKLAQHPGVAGSGELRVFLQEGGTLGVSSTWQALVNNVLVPTGGGISIRSGGIGSSSSSNGGGGGSALLKGLSRLPGQLLGTDTSVPSAADAARSSRHSTDLLRRLREFGEKIKQDYQAPPVLDDDELRLREHRVSLEEQYQVHLGAAGKAAERLLKEFEEMGRVVGDVGMSLMRVSKYEDEEGGRCGGYSDIGSGARTLAAETRHVAHSSVRLSRLSLAATGELAKALQPLLDEMALSPAMVEALKEREGALLTVQALEDNLAGKQREMQNLEGVAARSVAGGDVGRSQRLQKMRDEVAGLEAAIAAGRAEYERVKERNIEEIERHKQEKEVVFLRMTVDQARVQGVYKERERQVWEATSTSSSNT